MKKTNRKKVLLIVGVCAFVLVAWVVLMVVIFGGDKDPKKPAGGATPTTPAGKNEIARTKQIWRETAVYEYNPDGSHWTRAENEYDDLGYPTVTKIYDRSGKCTVHEYTYTYDEHLRMTQVDMKETHAEGGFSLMRGTIRYREDGSVAEMTTYDVKPVEDKAVMKERREYDGKQRIVVDEDYDDNGRLEFREEFVFYDSEECPYTSSLPDMVYTHTFSEYDPDGTLVSATKWIIDPFGRIIEERTFRAKNGPDWKAYRLGECDEQNRLVKELFVLNDGSTRVAKEYGYVGDSLRQEKSYGLDDGNNAYLSERILYNEFQKVSRTESYGNDGVVCEWSECDYDKDGNLVETREYRAGWGQDKGELTGKMEYIRTANSVTVYEYSYVNTGSMKSKYMVEEYDTEHRLLHRFTRSNSQSGGEDDFPLGKEESYTYDEAGRVISEYTWSDYQVGSSKENAYDSDGNLVKEIIKRVYQDGSTLLVRHTEMSYASFMVPEDYIDIYALDK